jgi:dihydroflavonol-4-reductase
MKMKSKKILVLGATGFIGGHIALCALRRNWEVIGLQRDPKRFGHLKRVQIQWVLGDLMDSNSLYKAMQGMDVIFHAAAFYPKSGEISEVPAQIAYAEREMQNVIQAARKANVERLIYTSSLTTIGHPDFKENRLADERDFYKPGSLSKSAYYESKIVMEQIFMDACSQGLPGVVLNPTAVFGPGDLNLSMASLLIAVAKGWMVVWIPGFVNVVDVRDVAECHITAVDKGQIGERYIIGGHNYTIREALQEVALVAGVKPPRFKISLGLLHGITVMGDIFPFLKLPSNHMRAIHLWQGYNTLKAQQALELSPRPFHDTVQDSLNWLKLQGHL